MFSQTQTTQICATCNGTNFYKEDGYYFCSKCQTQNEVSKTIINNKKYLIIYKQMNVYF